MRRRLKIDFCSMWRQFSKTENYFYDLLSERFDLVISENPDVLIYGPYNYQHIKYDCLKIFYTAENVRPDYLECDYSFSFDEDIPGKNFRLPLYVLYADLKEFNKNLDFGKLIEEKKEFCNFLYTNPRCEIRNEFFHLLSKYKKVDSGGGLYNNLGYRVENKMEFLKKYRFTISFENESYPGYSTEKIIQPLMCRSIPIYWGNPLIAKDFNEDRFINVHAFKDLHSVVEKVLEIENSQELYFLKHMGSVFNSSDIPKYFYRENILDEFQRIIDQSKFTMPVSKSVKGRLWRANRAATLISRKILNRFFIREIF